MSIDAYGIHLYIHFYALILMTAMGAGAWLTARRAREQGLDENHVWNGLIWAIVPAIIGARLYHVLTPTPSAMAADGVTPLTTAYYLTHPIEILVIWNGGLGIYGGILGGVIGVYLYTRRHHMPLLKWMDLAAPGVALGQAIGRWGNFVNHEIYGAPTTLPWGIYIPPDKRVAPFLQYSTFHPLFFYESVWNLATCVALILVHRRFRDQLRDGDITLMYLMSYATIRFFLDFLRLDSNGFGPITTAQLVSLVTFVVAAFLLFMQHRAPRRVAHDSD